LEEHGEKERYIALYKDIHAHTDLKELTKLERTQTMAIIKQYPISAIKLLCIEDPINTMLDNAVAIPVGNYFGYSWKKKPPLVMPDGETGPTYKKSTLLYILNYLGMLVYFIVYVLFALYLIELLIKKQYISLLLYAMIFGAFIIPVFIAGIEGSRLRMPAEWMIVAPALYMLYKISQTGHSGSEENPLHRIRLAVVA
jgi:hypothetical protein